MRNQSLQRFEFHVYLQWAIWCIATILMVIIRFSNSYLNEQYFLYTGILLCSSFMLWYLTEQERIADEPPPIWIPVNTPTPKIQKSNDVSGFVYLLQGPNDLYKIGHTKDPDNRLRTFEVRLPFEVEFIHLIPCEDRFTAERQLHRQFAHRRIRGEWFNLTPEDVATIKSIQSL